METFGRGRWHGRETVPQQGARPIRSAKSVSAYSLITSDVNELSADLCRRSVYFLRFIYGIYGIYLGGGGKIGPAKLEGVSPWVRDESAFSLQPPENLVTPDESNQHLWTPIQLLVMFPPQ